MRDGSSNAIDNTDVEEIERLPTWGGKSARYAWWATVEYANNCRRKRDEYYVHLGGARRFNDL
jgi:hypothetical protein